MLQIMLIIGIVDNTLQVAFIIAYLHLQLYMKKEGIKYVFYQDIFRKSDQKVVVKSTVETVCVVNGRLSSSELFDNVFAPYLK